MSLKELVEGDVVVLTLRGNMLGDSETEAFRDRIKTLAAEGFLKVVLDLSSAAWVNSAGLGAMISAMTTLNRQGGDLRIANITDKIQSLFLVTQLVKVFKTYESTERAVSSYHIDPISGIQMPI
ncbi:MAG: STAS domain-containing protein [Ignavibacteriae bacterium]|nr:STAS domain-containing protein [Ignavibacteriota bacterium]